VHFIQFLTLLSSSNQTFATVLHDLDNLINFLWKRNPSLVLTTVSIPMIVDSFHLGEFQVYATKRVEYLESWSFLHNKSSRVIAVIVPKVICERKAELPRTTVISLGGTQIFNPKDFTPPHFPQSPESRDQNHQSPQPLSFSPIIPITVPTVLSCQTVHA